MSDRFPRFPNFLLTYNKQYELAKLPTEVLVSSLYDTQLLEVSVNSMFYDYSRP
jgi:hypothetical protein